MSFRHLITLQELPKEDIQEILNLAQSFKQVILRPIKKVPTLKGKTIVNMFFEPSTRTRTSFELAAKRLSADVLNIQMSTSSVVKGETLLDTLATIEAMQIDMVVIRHNASGVPLFLTKNIKSSVINAGDGMHEHHAGLLDMFSIIERRKDRRFKRVHSGRHSAFTRSAQQHLGAYKDGRKVKVVAPR